VKIPRIASYHYTEYPTGQRAGIGLSRWRVTPQVLVELTGDWIFFRRSKLTEAHNAAKFRRSMDIKIVERCAKRDCNVNFQ